MILPDGTIGVWFYGGPLHGTVRYLRHDARRFAYAGGYYMATDDHRFDWQAVRVKAEA